MRKNKNTSKIILATIVAILATMISFSAFNNMNKQLGEQQKLIDLMQKTKPGASQESYAYAIATKDLKAGEIVADEDVDFKQENEADSNNFENRSDVVNKVLLKDITNGENFTTAHIAKVSNDDISLKDGYRALTLPAESFQGKSNKMVVGSNVDIFSATNDSDWGLENVRIIAFEGAKDAAGSQNPSDVTTANAITFEVPVNEIAEFISNTSRSKMVLVARSPNDKKVTHKKKHSAFSAGPSPTSYSSLPNLPASVPIQNMSGLPQPIKPEAIPTEVEVIEANVKSKVTFD